MKDLPQGLQQACQTVQCIVFLLFKFALKFERLSSDKRLCFQGLVSSALLVKFLAMNARPTTVRFISRKLPEGMSRAFIGR